MTINLSAHVFGTHPGIDPAPPPRRQNAPAKFTPGRPDAAPAQAAIAALAAPPPPRPKKRARPAPRAPAGKAAQAAAARGNLDALPLEERGAPRPNEQRRDDAALLRELDDAERPATPEIGRGGADCDYPADEAEPAEEAAGALARQQIEAELHALSGQEGIFEVLLPGGESLGVVVNSAAASLSFLLSPSEAALGARLREHKMELESRLQRRISRNVEIAVL